MPALTSSHLCFLFSHYSCNSTTTSLTCLQLSLFTGCLFISRQLRFSSYGPFYLSHSSSFMYGLMSIQACAAARGICNATSLLSHQAYSTMPTGSFPRVKYGRGVLLTTHPLLVPQSWKSRAIPLPTLWATTGPVTGRVEPHLYPPSGPQQEL